MWRAWRLVGILLIISGFLETSCAGAGEAANGQIAKSDQADPLTPRQREIMRIALSADGYITEQLHGEFWAPVSKEIREHDTSLVYLRQSAGVLVAAGQDFQREFWLSVKATLRAGRVVKTPNYEAAQKRARQASSLPGYREQKDIGAENGERLLAAAAQGKPFQTPQGQMYVTTELVSQVLSGLDGSAARFKILLNPTWTETVEEYRYPEAHVATLSPTPFSVERQKITIEGGRQVEQILLTRRLNDTDYALISYAVYGGQWADPHGATIRTVQASLRSIGEPVTRAASSSWRNRVSATGSAKANTSDGTLYASIRVVELRELGSVLILTTTSQRSLAETYLLLENLENSIQLLSGF